MYMICIKTFKISICNTKHTQNTPIHVQQSVLFFFKYISFGLPEPLWTAFELKKLICLYARCDNTNATCP